VIEEFLSRKRLTRRKALQGSVAAIVASAVATDSWTAPATASEPEKRNAIRNGSTFFSAQEVTLLAEVAEIMIPTTDTPGARAANVHGFVDGMMAEWAMPRTQNAIRKALADIEVTSRKRFGSSFMGLPPDRRLDVLTVLDTDAFASEEGIEIGTHPFVRLKELIYLGYYFSETGATQELQFKLVPGRYEACSPLANIGRAWADDFGMFFAISRLQSNSSGM
jgi:hypothetical protein